MGRGRSLQILAEQEVQPGSTLTLTIDADIQYETEQVLADVVKQFSAKRATAVVIGPETGEVIAMANAPLFDTNAYGKAKTTSDATWPSPISTNPAPRSSW